ncbi:MAG: hypothetical protein ABJB61_07025 [bacterium]
MQREILEKNPSARLRVYVIWFSMLPTDARSRWGWTSGVLTDGRATHFWDEKKIVGRWFAKQDNPQADSPGIVWDAFYLYGPNAEWDSKPEPLIIFGATVRDEAGKLKEKLVPLLTEKVP